jgi:predicted O-linked N-acetylglucosamine transferase (SPINDLY family)
VAAAFDTFSDISNLGTHEAMQIARNLDLDIAVDLNGHTAYARTELFSLRLAPIQVNYLGYPGTMGSNFMDYIVADEVLIPPADRPFYAEKIVYVPGSYQANDSKRQVSATEFSRQQLGLPDKGFVYCCFNNNFKITPAIFDCWMRILGRVDGSVLWLLQDNLAVVKNLRHGAEAHNIDPRRIIFADRVPMPDHLARQRTADLFLDTLNYNAHTTASDALWVQLPVLTCIGKSFAARVAASLLTALDMQSLITHDLQQYEELAVALAKSPDRLASLKAQLAEKGRTADLFKGKAAAESLEHAYREMHERWRNGLEPDHIFVPPRKS